MSGDCGCAYKTEGYKEKGDNFIPFTDTIFGEGERSCLRTVPAHIRMEYILSEDTLNLLLVHDSLCNFNEYLFENREEKSMLRFMEGANADILCFGYTHKPYCRTLQLSGREVGYFRHTINIGLVEKPKDGDPRGCYVLLNINSNSSIVNKDSVLVEFIRFPYNMERATKAVEDSLCRMSMPACFGRGTETGGLFLTFLIRPNPQICVPG